MEVGKAGASQPTLGRWWKDHSDLDHLIGALLDTIFEARPAAASAALEELAEAVEDHLGVEEEVYFPLIERQAPDATRAVRKVRLAHDDLRAQLGVVREHLAGDQLALARSELHDFLKRLQAHEEQEVELVARLGQ